MDYSKVPMAKPISAKKAAAYKKIFDDPQKIKEIFEQAEASSRWAEALRKNEHASQCTKADGNIDEEDNDKDDEEEEELVASKQEKKIEKFGVGDGDGSSNLLVLGKEEEELVLPTKGTTTKSIPTTESEITSHKAT
ncbi:uncharacterized protein EAF01_011715 [Botrytis porri]|nr:uncharacterized protein EAF01_011715 [Botrytis porri]KAF7882263.1 hypothetical protein EAF01_011715 [Botrytis porri]